jgi:hypothetical protein
MRIAVAFGAERKTIQDPDRVPVGVALATVGNGLVRTRMADGAAELAMLAPALFQLGAHFCVAVDTDQRIRLLVEGDGARPVRRMALLAVLFRRAGSVWKMAFAAGKRFRMARVAGGAGKAGMEARRRGEFIPDARMAIEASGDALTGQRQLPRPVRIAVADQTRALAIEMRSPLVAIAARPDDLQIAGGMTAMAIEAGEQRLMLATFLLQVIDLLFVAFQAILFAQGRCRLRRRGGGKE